MKNQCLITGNCVRCKKDFVFLHQSVFSKQIIILPKKISCDCGRANNIMAKWVVNSSGCNKCGRFSDPERTYLFTVGKDVAILARSVRCQRCQEKDHGKES